MTIPTRYTNQDGYKKFLRNHDTDGVVVLRSELPTIKVAADKPHTISFIISNEDIDRYADFVNVTGWDVNPWKKNPVVLWSHDQSQAPIARGIEIEVDKREKELRAVAEFTPADLNPFGDMVYRMIKAKFLNAVSVGFLPKSYAWVTEQEDADRARRGGINYHEQELLEFSVVPVPALSSALVQSRSFGIDTTPMVRWAEQVLDEDRMSEQRRLRLEAIRTAASPTGRPLMLEVGDMVERLTLPTITDDGIERILVNTKDVESVVEEVVAEMWPRITGRID